jgi:transketolase
VEILVALHCHVMRATSLDDPDRDYFLLSKGHAVPALYGLMVEMGYLPVERLGAHLSVHDHIYWHPNRSIPGVEFHSGSLGHGIAVAAGVALDFRLRKSANRAFVLVGDGELDEGSVWETLLVAAAQRLDALTVVVDRNRFQANFGTEQLLPLEPLVDKLSAFGCAVRQVDGHDLDSLVSAFSVLPAATGRATVIVANTVRGKGIARIENDWERWFVQLGAEDVDAWIEELRAEAT